MIDAIMDVDGDFSPLSFTLAGATCGDWQGSFYEDPVAGVRGIVHASKGKVTEAVDSLRFWSRPMPRPSLPVSLQQFGTTPNRLSPTPQR